MTQGTLDKLSTKHIEFVDKLRFCKFASINAKDGSPHIAPTWFVYENNKILITTGENTVKVRNIRKDPNVAVLIDDGYKYVVVNGRARINKDMDGNKATERMAIKYLGEAGAKSVLADVLKEKHVAIEVTPEKVTSHNV
ncbi:MAG: PPOX class F420-dependent oxidoreductase [archaeon]|nr:PPOX class F420-dependent oxidoreductase [archaeon]